VTTNAPLTGPSAIRAGAEAICWASPTGPRMPGGPPCEACTRTAEQVLVAAVGHVDEPVARTHRPIQIGPEVCAKCGMFWPCRHIDQAIGKDNRG
jgi:hypothetical protein